MSPFRLEKPTQPGLTILGKIEQELSFVAFVGNAPNMSQDVMSLCPRH